MRIGIWKTKTDGCYRSHYKGLSPMDVEQFHSLKVGDRLFLFMGGSRDGKEPDGYIKLAKTYEEKKDDSQS